MVAKTSDGWFIWDPGLGLFMLMVGGACGGPEETTRSTAEPTFTNVPAVGLSLITLPAATVLLDCVVTVPTVRPAPVIAVVAAACVNPTTFGTANCAGP